ncbi:hypothetical protein DID88_001537 [Monilinia fructigena]|uniref:Integrase catalytic domain-containing protein n=1 Tax=Monilinia fructigena TaxID=38457 RepID=A0A395IY63_9HELO|nr:hypothetical protein DID88_001537 [Monilinia fructigena]
MMVFAQVAIADEYTGSLYPYTAMRAEVQNDIWILDSGASHHFTGSIENLSNVVQWGTPRRVKTANNAYSMSTAYGTATIGNFTLRDVWYVKDFRNNQLISVGTLAETGRKVIFEGGSASCWKNGQLEMAARRVNGSYIVRQPFIQQAYMVDTDSETGEIDANNDKAEIIHRRLGHLNYDQMDKLKKASNGLHYTKRKKSAGRKACEPCLAGRMNEHFNKHTAIRTPTKLRRLHMDLSGIQEPSENGNRYFIAVVDDATRGTWLRFIKDKSAETVVPILMYLISQIEKEFNCKVAIIRADNGKGEFGTSFQTEIGKRGLIFEPSPPGKHSMNGVAEKKIQDISATARSLLSESGIKPSMWELTVKHAVHLKNRSPTKALPFGEAGTLSTSITPYEAIYPFKELKEKSIPEPPGTERKRKPHSHDKQKATKRRVQLAAQEDVQENVHTNEQEEAQIQNELEEARIYPSRMLRQRQLQGTGHPAQNVQVPTSSRQRVQVVVEIPRVRPVPTATLVRVALNESCKKRLRKIFSDQVVQHVVALHVASAHSEDSLISNSESILEESVELEDAMRGDAQAWMEAIRNELQSLKDNDRFGKLARRKARLVIKGCLQTYGIDYQETFAGVARYSTLRTLLAKAAAEDLEIDNMDVDTAFLNGIQIERNRRDRSLKIHQSNYTKKILYRFGIDLSDTKDLPLPPGTVIRDAGSDDLLCEDDKTLYLQIVGSTIYSSNCTRPDIAYAVGQLARVMHAPGESHLVLAKHLLQYLAGTYSVGTVYSNRLNMLSYEYRAYTDSTWGSAADRKSVQGVALIRYGGAIVWSSTKQKSTSLCTMEAEIIAANEGAKELAWMEKLVKDLGERSEEEPFIPTLYCDNASGVDWMQENKFHSKAKHIDIRWHYIRKDMVDTKRLHVVWIPGTEQTADILTKQLTYPGFITHGKGLGLDLEC